MEEDVSVTIGNPGFGLALYFTGVQFRGVLQHVRDTTEQKFKCRPIKTWEIVGLRLSEALYENIRNWKEIMISLDINWVNESRHSNLEKYMRY